MSTEQFLAAYEERALDDARRRDTRLVAFLLETGKLSPQGMAALIHLLKTNFARPVGHPPGPRRDTPIWSAAAQLRSMVEFLKEKHPELRPAFRRIAIALLAKKHGVAESTLRNRVDRGV